MLERQDGELWKGMVAGLAGGIAGGLLMTAVHSLAGRLSRSREAEESPQHSAHRGKGRSAEQATGEDATVRAAAAISRGILGHDLEKREKRWAGPAVHYAMGALTGAVYGGVAELSPAVTRGAGMPFGTAVWLAADEIAVPVLDLAAPPSRHPPSVHARALAAHLAYGLATEAVRRRVRRAL